MFITYSHNTFDNNANANNKKNFVSLQKERTYLCMIMPNKENFSLSLPLQEEEEEEEVRKPSRHLHLHPHQHLISTKPCLIYLSLPKKRKKKESALVFMFIRNGLRHR